MQGEEGKENQLLAELHKLRKENARLKKTEVKLKQTQKALRQSEESVRILLNAQQQTAMLVDNRGIIRAINDFGARRLGKSPHDLEGLKAKDLSPRGHASLASIKAREAIKTGAPVTFEQNIGEKVLETIIHPISDSSGTATQIASFTKDITKNKAAEKEKLRRERLKAAIETAGAAIHEISQPLQIIVSLTELTLLRLESGNLTSEDLKKILKCSEKIAKITKKLERISKFHTKEYMPGTNILDLEKSTKT